MKRNKRWLLLVLAVFLTGDLRLVAEEKPTPIPTLGPYDEFTGPCHNDPRITGSGFSFKGRAGYLGGSLNTLKIWMVGTHRILGVPGYAPIPENLAAILRDDLGAQVYGEFTVCPYTPYKKGVMQYVCVDSVKITKVVKGQ